MVTQQDVDFFSFFFMANQSSYFIASDILFEQSFFSQERKAKLDYFFDLMLHFFFADEINIFSRVASREKREKQDLSFSLHFSVYPIIFSWFMSQVSQGKTKKKKMTPRIYLCLHIKVLFYIFAPSILYKKIDVLNSNFVWRKASILMLTVYICTTIKINITIHQPPFLTYRRCVHCLCVQKIKLLAVVNRHNNKFVQIIPINIYLFWETCANYPGTSHMHTLNEEKIRFGVRKKILPKKVHLIFS